ncbi:hypothetical protein Ri1_09480 [Aeromonas dhakensis]|nr:hypothetical protein Ri1_09480 [Aeromonas dhakensis]
MKLARDLLALVRATWHSCALSQRDPLRQRWVMGIGPAGRVTPSGRDQGTEWTFA